MRQHSKTQEGSNKSQRKAKWTNGLKLLRNMVENRDKQVPFTKAARRKLFVEARREALLQYKKKGK